MKYHLYHDESKVDGYWHGMLLVPENTKQIFFRYLKEIRKNTGYKEPIGIKKIREQNRVFTCAELWVLFAVGAMMSTFGRDTFPITLGKRIRGVPIWDGNFKNIVEVLIEAKFILFREKDNLKKMSNLLDYGGKVETTFRMGLKGGIHFLGSEEDPIEITKMHFDGCEHHQRNIDQNRIVGRLKDLREYFKIAGDKYSIDDRTSNHNNQGCQPYEDCQFLQLTDLLVGSFRVALGYITSEKKLHEKVAEPVKYVIEKYQKGYARMQNSRWKNSFCMSECFLEGGKWQFQTIEFSKATDDKQPNLLFTF